MDITFRRKPRKSMLGRRGYSIQLLREPSPTKKTSSTSTNDSTLTNFDNKPSEPEIPINQKTESPPSFPTLPEPNTESESNEEQISSFLERTLLHEDSNKENCVKAPPRTSVVCNLFANDSFEENETMLANSSTNETILATSLLLTVKKDEEDIKQLLKMVNSLLREKNACIQNSLAERKKLKEMKRNLIEKFQVVDKSCSSDVFYSPNERDIFQKPELTRGRNYHNSGKVNLFKEFHI